VSPICGTCHIFLHPLHTAPAIDEFGLLGLSGTSILKSLILKLGGASERLDRSGKKLGEPDIPLRPTTYLTN
jgi:hypothetical protein